MSVKLAGSLAQVPVDATDITPVDTSERIKVTVAIRRGAASGVTLRDYAHGLISGAVTEKLNHSQFDAMFAPIQADIDLISQFAVANGLTVYKVYTNSATIKLTGSVGQFNQAFGIVLNKVTTTTKQYYNYVGELSIPAELSGIILAVFGLDNSLELTRSSNLSAGVGTTVMTPQQIATAYNFPAVTGQGQCVGIIEFGGGYTTENLTGTFSRAGITPTPNVIGVSAGGQNNIYDSSSDQEVMLDIYIVAGLIPQGTTTVYFGPDARLSSFWNTINTAIHDTTNNPSALSISWGAPEHAWPINLINQLDLLFYSAIVMGITVTVATGDYGSEAYSGELPYTVQYPASSPYVLACGGTVITNNNLATETVWNYGGGGSAGGVSQVYTQVPSYQVGISTTKYPSGVIAPITRRAIPDVGGHAVGYQYYFGLNSTVPGSPTYPYGTLQPNGSGTSAVAPLYAGLVGRINQAIGGRCGFLNTFIYNNNSAFHDITTGNNACPAPVGYSATVGWDACTGLGSPNGVSLLQAVISQPAPVSIPTEYPTDTYGTRPSSGQTYPRVKVSQIR